MERCKHETQKKLQHRRAIDPMIYDLCALTLGPCTLDWYADAKCPSYEPREPGEIERS